MKNHKTNIRFFTIADFEKEEQWLESQHREGWKLNHITFPCFYQFEQCPPEKVVYRLDYQNKQQDSNYHQMFRDYGWEYCQHFLGWHYFRKPVTAESDDTEYEIFSDNTSRIDMIEHIIKTRMLPLVLIFFACLLPNLINAARYAAPSSILLTILFGVLTILYIGLMVYCGIKLHHIRARYNLPSR